VYASGLAQGVALVTFPAAGTIFTDPTQYGLSNTAYGAMFVPQAVMAIAAALLGAAWARRAGPRRVFLIGLAADLASMSLLVASRFAQTSEPAAYVLLLLATGSLGVGFGFTVPALNTFTAAFHPAKVDSSILVLNALLGLGTALAPAFVAVFVGLGFWWGLPVVTAAFVAVLLVVSLRLPLRTGMREKAARARARTGVPARFWLFAAFALLYGICETMNGNWSSLDVKQLGLSATVGSLALAAFWATVTAGRVLFAAVRKRFSTGRAYHVLPFVLAAAFAVIGLLPQGSATLAVLAFALAGLGCSALLPLTISFAEEELVTISASVAGGVIAFYQVGYGIAAFGGGPLQAAGVSLPALFGLSAVLAAAMGGVSFSVARRGF
jgi:MFS family permease